MRRHSRRAVIASHDAIRAGFSRRSMCSSRRSHVAWATSLASLSTSLKSRVMAQMSLEYCSTRRSHARRSPSAARRTIRTTSRAATSCSAIAVAAWCGASVRPGTPTPFTADSAWRTEETHSRVSRLTRRLRLVGPVRLPSLLRHVLLDQNVTSARKRRGQPCRAATMAEPDDITEVDLRLPEPQARPRGVRRARWPVVLVLAWATLAVVDIAFFHLSPGSGRAAARSAAAPGLPAHGRPITGAQPRVHASRHPAARARVLAPVSAAAIGPEGLGSGDDSQNARLALVGNPATPWHTSWYTTAHFGNLRTGTGLLLDLGRPVTVTKAQITLGSIPGADIELRAGNVPALADLQPVARVTDAGSVLRLTPAGPVRARYLLIWFTLLPPDGSGTYQADISGVSLRGEA